MLDCETTPVGVAASAVPGMNEGCPPEVGGRAHMARLHSLYLPPGGLWGRRPPGSLQPPNARLRGVSVRRAPVAFGRVLALPANAVVAGRNLQRLMRVM